MVGMTPKGQTEPKFQERVEKMPFISWERKSICPTPYPSVSGWKFPPISEGLHQWLGLALENHSTANTLCNLCFYLNLVCRCTFLHLWL